MKKYLVGLYIVFIPLLSVAQLPPVQIENSVEFIEGGVGSDESEAIEKSLKAWPLLLEFSQKNGVSSEWISGVLLVVRSDAGSQILSHQVDGPMILLGLKPGKYFIEANYGGQKKQIECYVQHGQHIKIVFNWR